MRTIALLFLSWPGFAAGRSAEDFTTELRRVDNLLFELSQVRERLAQGFLPEDEEWELGRTTREQVLRGFDPTQAMRLGFTATQLRARLLPGFASELSLLSELRDPELEAGEPASPFLFQMLDLEKDLTREALRLLYGWGLPNPLETGALAADAVAVEPVAAAPGPRAQPGTEQPADEKEAEVLNPALQAESFYQEGRYAEALAAYQMLDLPMQDSTLRVHYRIAECLLKTGEPLEAARAFQRIAEEFPGTTWGGNATWQATYANAIAVLEGQKKDAAEDGP